MKKSESPTNSPNTYSEKVFSNEGLIALSEDFSLPEQLDDVKRVIKCDAMLRPGGRYVNGAEVEYEGEVVYSVLYITDVNSIKNVVFKSAYSGKYVLPFAVGDLCVTVMPSCDGVACKPVSVRKMNLRCNVKMKIIAYKECVCDPAFEGENAQEDEAECEKRSAEVEYVRPLQLEKTDCRVSRDVEIPDSNVKEIVSCTMELRPFDMTSLEGKCEMKIEALFTCVYTVMNEDDVIYRSQEKKFILENSVESPDMHEEYEGSAKAYCKELSVSLSGGGAENRSIEVDFTYDICARLFGNDVCLATSDVYSCDYQNKADMRTLFTDSFLRCDSGNAEFNSSVDCPHIVELIAPGGQAVLRSLKFDEAEKKLYADADVLITGVTRDTDGRLSVFENTVPVRVTLDAPSEDVKGADVYLSSCDIALKDATITASGNVTFECLIFENHENNIVKSVSVDRNSPRDKSGALPITFYYPEEGENLWDIAKRYATTVDLVRDANELSENENVGKKVLIIPQKRKKPLFSKVIGK